MTATVACRVKRIDRFPQTRQNGGGKFQFIHIIHETRDINNNEEAEEEAYEILFYKN